MAWEISADSNRDGIRRLNPGRDLGQLADLLETAFGSELALAGRRVLRDLRMLARLGSLGLLIAQAGSEADHILGGIICEQDGKVVGNVTMSRTAGRPGRWQISNVAVLDSHRGRGIARQMMEVALDTILARGGRVAYLFVRHDNVPARGLYRGLGFEDVDQITDLRSDAGPDSSTLTDLRVMQRLRPADGERVYRLVSDAISPGQRWLSSVVRSRYVHSVKERAWRWIKNLVSGHSESLWGVPDEGSLKAVVSVSATWGWNRGHHRLEVWVHPDVRGQVEESLAKDIVALLQDLPARPVRASLPQCEESAARALEGQGFDAVRTLVLMRRAL